jgi:hypothetical protein
MNHPVPHEPPVAESGGTGLPLLRTWRSVYLFVLGCFAAVVVFLAVFTRAFS